MPLDDVLEAQAIMTNTSIPDDINEVPHPVVNFQRKSTVKNPKKGRVEEKNPKPPHLDMDINILYPLILVFSVALALVLGFFVGVFLKTREFTQEVLGSRVEEKITKETPKEEMYSTVPSATPLTVPASPVVKKKPQSSVMKYHSPQEIRRRKEAEALEQARAHAMLGNPETFFKSV